MERSGFGPTLARMRIVLVNWARFADGTLNGGGVNGYCRQLAMELVSLGHEVAWLNSGLVYLANPVTASYLPCEIRRMPDDAGVQVFEVINSPVVAPGVFQFDDPLGEVSAPELEAELTRFFQLWKPDVVHFHNIEGFSCGCVDAARTAGPGWKGAVVAFSLHNYHTVCPQVYLMQQGKVPCFDFDSGHACVSCSPGQGPAHEKRLRSGMAEAEDQAGARRGTQAPSVVSRVLGAAKRRLTAAVSLPVLTPEVPGQAVRSTQDLDAAKEPGATGVAGVAPWTAAQFEQPGWSPLSNEIKHAPHGSRVVNDFGVRRKAMVEMLNRCDRVFAVSSFVRRKFESMGVHTRVLREVPIGSRMTELVERHPWLAVRRGMLRTGPVRMAFMGYNNAYKGLGMLLDSLDLLVPEVLERIELFIWAKDIERDLGRVESLRGRLGGLHVKGVYRYEEIPGMLTGIDVGLVPSIWWDNGPQTVMEYMACGIPVIAAALGGIVDVVRDGENGLLFCGNDRFALAATLARVSREPAMIEGLRRGVRPPQTMGAHAGVLAREYQALVDGRKGE